MFKTEEGVKNFVDKLEKFIQVSIFYATAQSKGLDMQAGELAKILNKAREELDEFIKVTCGITVVDDTKEFKCPDCGAAMRLRANRQSGEKFWGCTKYPDCRGTRDSAGLSKADREEREYKHEQQSGFSFNRK